MSKKRVNRYPVGPTALRYAEPTIWALRKNVSGTRQDNNAPAERSLYEHIYGYDPIKVASHDQEHDEAIRKGSAENPELNILNPQTNFMVMELASQEAPSETPKA